MGRGATKVRTPEQQLIKLARRLLPAVQARRGDFTFHDVQNRTDADQRHMVRSDEKRTLRRLTRVEKLQRAGTITRDEAQACQWYADAYSLGYDTIGMTAHYQGSGVRSGGVFCLASRYRAQQEARENYDFAKQGISPFLLPLFERVVIEGLTIGQATQKAGRQLTRYTSAFRLAANQLHGRIAHILPIE